jgi:hypothetical protein
VLECVKERGVRGLHSSEHGACPPGRGHGVGGAIGYGLSTGSVSAGFQGSRGG